MLSEYETNAWVGKTSGEIRWRSQSERRTGQPTTTGRKVQCWILWTCLFLQLHRFNVTWCLQLNRQGGRVCLFLQWALERLKNKKEQKKKKNAGRGSVWILSELSEAFEESLHVLESISFSPIYSFPAWLNIEKILFDGNLIQLILFMNIVSNNAVML